MSSREAGHLSGGRYLLGWCGIGCARWCGRALTLVGGRDLPLQATRYSTGLLAVLHDAAEELSVLVAPSETTLLCFLECVVPLRLRRLHLCILVGERDRAVRAAAADGLENFVDGTSCQQTSGEEQWR